jgi:hypothetical protein
MNLRRLSVIGAVAAATAFAGGAIAATSDEPERAIIDDAAKRLDVTPEQLRDALAAAQDAQLDQAVKDGKLTQAQADEMKARREAEGRVLGIGPRGPGGPGRHGPGFGGPGHHRGGPGFGRGRGGGPRELFSAAAKALGITEAQLVSRLRDGKTLAQIAKAEGKTVADVKTAVQAAAAKRLDADVKAGRITKAQRDEILEHIGEHVDRLAEDGVRRPGHR